MFIGPNTLSDNETITKYEIMDGLPVRGESEDQFSSIDLIYFDFFFKSCFCIILYSGNGNYKLINL